MFKYLTSFLILSILAACSSETGIDDQRSSSLVKPNFSVIQARYDCLLSEDKSLNSLEAFIPNFVIKIKESLPSAGLEIFFNQDTSVNKFSLFYLDNDINFSSEIVSDLMDEEGMSDFADCIIQDNQMLSSNLYIDNKVLNFNSFEVEVLDCKFNDEYNYGTFSIEVDSFLNLIRKQDILYFAKFQQVNELSSEFTWINYLSSNSDKDILYKGWINEQDSIIIQESFNIQSTCESSTSYRGYKVL